MKFRILAIGKPKLPYAALGVQEYLARLKHYGAVDVAYGKAGTAAEEGTWLLGQSEGTWRIVLDERGRQQSSLEWAEKLSDWENRSLKGVSFLVGGADGHAAAMRDKANEVWSLSRMTMQHELALVVLLEQLYRACTIRRREPYHRA